MALSKTAINRIIFVLLIIIVATSIVFLSRLSTKIQNLQGTLVQSEQEGLRLRSIVEKQQIQFQALTQENDSLLAEKEALLKEVDDFELRLLQLQELLTKEQQAKEALQSENENLNQEVFNLQDEIRLWEGKVTNLEEVKIVKDKRTQSKRQLKKNIRILYAKVREEKNRIQAEINRIKAEMGNRGFMTKNGKATFIPESEVQLDKIIVKPSAQ